MAQFNDYLKRLEAPLLNEFHFTPHQKYTLTPEIEIQLSIAVSLKRIADALDRNTDLVAKIAACVSEEKAMIRADTF